MSRTIFLDTQTGTVAAAANMTPVDLRECYGFGLYINTTVATAAAKTFTAAVTDICTAASHGYYTGLKVAATTDTTLPAGLSATNYYIIRIDANTFKLASSAANALLGTAVDITDTGTGVHTLTPAALAGASYKIQVSPDNVLWFDLASATDNITTTSDFNRQYANIMYQYIRVVFAMTAGQVAYTITTLARDYHGI